MNESGLNNLFDIVDNYIDTLPKPEKPKIKIDKPALGMRREDIEKLRNTSGFTFIQKPLE